jgi:NADP-dependent 3-hydroxy acid dehydrogenase YdfG
MLFRFGLPASKLSEGIAMGTNRMQPNLTVVITGASAGLGRAIAHEFGKTGASVGLISRDLSALEATAG